jgi:hypothetical protein
MRVIRRILLRESRRIRENIRIRDSRRILLRESRRIRENIRIRDSRRILLRESRRIRENIRIRDSSRILLRESRRIRENIRIRDIRRILLRESRRIRESRRRSLILQPVSSFPVLGQACVNLLGISRTSRSDTGVTTSGAEVTHKGSDKPCSSDAPQSTSQQYGI